MLTSSHHAFVRVGVCVCSGRFLYWTSTINQVTSEKHLLQLRELCVYNDWLSSAGVTAAQLDDTTLLTKLGDALVLRSTALANRITRLFQDLSTSRSTLGELTGWVPDCLVFAV